MREIRQIENSRNVSFASESVMCIVFVYHLYGQMSTCKLWQRRSATDCLNHFS